jgi:GGDEF domain-containing protein
VANTNPLDDPNFGSDLVPKNPLDDPEFGKPRGMVSAFGAGVGTTVAQAAQAAGRVTGATSLEKLGANKEKQFAPVEGESTAAGIARAAGGLVGWLPVIGATVAAIPAAPEELGGAGIAFGLNALRGMAGMTLPAATAKVNTTADLKEKGIDDATANKAGWAAGATTLAMGAVPLSMTGGLLVRAATGAASGLAVGEAQRQVGNETLSGHPDLQTGFTASGAIQNAVVGAMLGGILGPRPIKTAIADFHNTAAADVNAGTPIEHPPLEFTKPEKTPITLAEPGARLSPETPEGIPFIKYETAAQTAERVRQRDQEAQIAAGLKKSEAMGFDWQPPTAEAIKQGATLSPQELELVPKMASKQQLLTNIATTVKEEGSPKLPKQYIARLSQGGETTGELAEKAHALGIELDKGGKDSDISHAGTLYKMADYLGWKPSRGEENAIQEPGAGGVLQHPQGGVGEAGSERGRVEPGQQGQEVAAQGREGNAPGAEKAPAIERRAGPPPETERRTAGEAARAEFEKMTPDQRLAALVEYHQKHTEMNKSLLDAHEAARTSPLTGLPNKLAYEESKKLPVQIFADIDGLKKINDTQGHEAGNVAIKAMADAIAKHTDAVYHISGDEFHAQAESRVEARRVMDAARATLAEKGYGFSYGTGKDIKVAEKQAYKDKEARKKAGLRTEREEPAAAKPDRPEIVALRNFHRKQLGLSPVDKFGVPAKEPEVSAPQAETIRRAWRVQAGSEIMAEIRKGAGLGENIPPALGENIPPKVATHDPEFEAKLQAARDQYAKSGEPGDFRKVTEIIEQGPHFEAEQPGHDEDYLASTVNEPENRDQQIHLLQDKYDILRDEASQRYENGERIDPRTGDLLASRGKFAKNPATQKDIEKVATELLGSKDATDRIIVYVTDLKTQIPDRVLKELRAEEAKSGLPITVAFAHNGKMYVMANQIAKGRERAVIMHEVGVHLGMEKLIGKANFTALANQIREWGKGIGAPDEVALGQKVRDKIARLNLKPEHIDQETVAYFVQHAIESGIDPTHLSGQAQNSIVKWLRKIWLTMKAALYKLKFDPTRLTAQDVVDIAHGAATAHGEAALGVEGFQPQTIVHTLRSADAVDFQAGPRQAAEAVDTVLSKAASMWDGVIKPALLRTHLQWAQMTHIADITENLIPRLTNWAEDTQNPIREKIDSLLKSGAMAVKLNHQTRQIVDSMNRLQPKQQEALFALMGKYQLAKVFPNKTFEEHPWLKPGEQQLYREAKQLYNQPGVTEAYNVARLHNQMLHDSGMAAMLKSMGHIYGAPEEIWGKIDALNGMGKEVKTLQDWVAKSPDADLREQFKMAMDLHEAKKNESYFHIGRDGDFMVRAAIKDTPEAKAALQAALQSAGVKDKIVINPEDLRFFSKFETFNEMLAVTKQMDVLQKAGHLEDEYTSGKVVEKLKALDSSAPSFIRGMLAKIDADPHLEVEEKTQQQEMLRRLYIDMLPESSVSKYFARRSGTPGYSADMIRSFAKRASGAAYFVAQNATRGEQASAMARLREATVELGKSGSPHYDPAKQQYATDVINELNQRTANILTPLNTPTMDKLSSFGHTFFLSASPGFILQNLAQPYQLTLPYLGARHGFRASAVAMGSAGKDALAMMKDAIQEGYKDGKWTGILDATITTARSNISETDKRAANILISTGRVDFTQAGGLSNVMAGAGEVASALDRTKQTANFLSQQGEILNRMQTGLAAFRLEMKRNGGDEAKAHEYMTKAVDDTQINYATENRARAIGKHGVFGQVTPLVLAFQQYNMGVIQLLGKLTMQAVQNASPGARAEAVKSLAGIMATTGILAGTMGLPFAGVVMGAYNAFVGDNDHPVDAKTDYQNFLFDTFGHDAGAIMAHGAANYLIGADVAQKLGQDSVLPFTQLASQLLDSRQALKDRINSGMLQFAGPVVNAGAGIAEGVNKIADGNVMKGMEQMFPSALRGVTKAVDVANNGFTDSKGNQLPLEATTWDAIIQAAGFTPTKLTTQREAQQGVKAIENALRLRASVLESKFVEAVEAHDMPARQQALEELTAFRQANPSIQINLGQALQQRARARAIAGMTGVEARARQLPFAAQQTRFTGQQQPLLEFKQQQSLLSQ